MGANKYCSICGKLKYEDKNKRCRCFGRFWVTKEQYNKIAERNRKARNDN